MNKNSFWAKYFKSSEEVISMFLGLVIVVVVVGLIYNFFQRRRGNVDLAGITDQKQNVNIPTGTIALTSNPSPSLRPTNTIRPINTPRPTNTIRPTNTVKPSITRAPIISTTPAASNTPPDSTSTPVISPTGIPQHGSSGEYVVKRNDSLWKIALANYGSGYNWVDIARENKLKNPGVLHVGQKLVLPSVAKKAETVVRPTTEPNKIEGDIYTVVRGDSLWKIAVRRYSDGFQWTKIYEANKNKLARPGILKIGTLLTLPAIK